MRGRKPKPIELRVLHGSAAARAYTEHPEPRRALPRCPERLTGEARKCWKRLSKELYDAGLLTTVDYDALAMYCDAHARELAAATVLENEGEILRIEAVFDDAGKMLLKPKVVRHPAAAERREAQALKLKLAAEFGMTPSSRSRVAVEISAAKRAARAVPRMRPVEDKCELGGNDPRKALGE